MQVAIRRPSIPPRDLPSIIVLASPHSTSYLLHHGRPQQAPRTHDAATMTINATYLAQRTRSCKLKLDRPGIGDWKANGVSKQRPIGATPKSGSSIRTVNGYELYVTPHSPIWRSLWLG